MIALAGGSEKWARKALRDGHRRLRNAACGHPGTPPARSKVNARLIEFERLRAINSNRATEVNKEI